MTMRAFSTWGRGTGAGIFGRVRVGEDDSAIDRVVARLERETGLRRCGGPRDEGTALDHGRPTARHYAVTLGTPCRGGGWTPRGEVWIAIPCE